MLYIILFFLGAFLLFGLIMFLPIIIESVSFEVGQHKKHKKEETQRERIIQENTRKRHEEETIERTLKEKYQNNPNLNKMFDDCVSKIIELCKETQNTLIERKGAEETLELYIDVSIENISIIPGCDLDFIKYGILPLEGDDVYEKINTIKEMLAERLCSEINKIDSNIMADGDDQGIYVTITNELQGVRL